MSPNEFQLRAALREGEGDGVDADVVLVHAAQVVRHRRRRIATAIGATAAAAAVAGIATGIVLAGGGSNGRTVAGADRTVPAASQATGGRAAGGRAANGVGPGHVRRSAGLTPASVPGTGASACPARPTPPATAAARAAGPMFARPVVSLMICGYPGGVTIGAVNRIVVTGAQATRIVDGLEHASTAPVPQPACMRPGVPSELELFPTAADGSRLVPVVVTFAVRLAQRS